MTTPAITEAAIVAARTAAVEFIQRHPRTPLRVADVAGAGEAAVTAALPELHAAWLAEVVAALRNQTRYEEWARVVAEAANYRWHTPASLAAVRVADYIRDTLGSGNA